MSKLGKNFYIILSSKIFWEGGRSIFTIYLLLLLWNTYNSGFVISIFYLLIFLIPSLISPLAGLQIDKYSKRKIMFVVIVVSLLSMIPSIVFHALYYIIIIFIILLICETYFNIGYNVIIRCITDEEKLIYANNMTTISFGAVNFMGYIIGAYFYNILAFKYILIFILILFILTAVLWVIAKIPEKNIHKSRESNNYSQIFKFLSENKNVFHLLVIYDVVILFTIVITTPAYVPYCFNILGMSATTYGFYSGFSSFLLVIFPLVIHKFISPDKVNKYATLSILNEGFILIFIALMPIFVHAQINRIIIFIILTVIISIPSTLEIAAFSTIFQQIVPLDKLGRFYSVRSLLRGIINTIGLIFAGIFIDSFGPIPIILIAGLLLIAIVYPTKVLLKNYDNKNLHSAVG